MNDLHLALDRALVHPPEYRAGLSNHLPMALHALHELGADAARLDAFARRYAARFAANGIPGDAVPLSDWRDALGRFDAYAALRAHFAGRIALLGRDAALRESLPALAPGVAAAAFHGLIRTAHAVEAGHDAELAAALAYWAARWQALPDPDAAAAQLPAEAWMATLAQEARSWRSGASLISARMAEVATTSAYRRLGGALRMDPDVPAALWRQAAALHAASGNFTILHVVTGCRALHVLAPWFEPVGAGWQAAVPAVAAAILASGLGADAAPALPPAGWPQVIDLALASDDDHVIKLVHAARDGERRVGGAAFLASAARAVA